VTDLVPVPPVAPDALDALRHGVADLDRQREELAVAGEWQRLAAGLAALRILRRDLSELERAVEHDIAELIPSKSEFVDGVGTLTVATDTRRSHWETDELATELVNRALDKGDIVHPLDVMGLLLGGMQVSGWRVTWLREHGYDPDDWCDTDYGRKTIRIQ
jgi:hypothetical protein